MIDSYLIWCEAERVEPAEGIGDVGVGVGGVVAGGFGVVVAEVVVVGAGFPVVVLAGEPRGAVDVTTVGGCWVGAPQGGPGVPGELAVGVDEVGGGADEVGDDGVEPDIEPRLVGAVADASASMITDSMAGTSVG